jgi:hypothetical protein
MFDLWLIVVFLLNPSTQIVDTTAELQLYVDESYTLDIPETSGYITITANTGSTAITLSFVIGSVRCLPCARVSCSADAVQL